MNKELEIINEIEENLFSFAKKIEFLSKEEKEFEINKINNLFLKIEQLELIEDLQKQFKKILEVNNITNIIQKNNETIDEINIIEKKDINTIKNNREDNIEDNIDVEVKKEILVENSKNINEKFNKEKEYFNLIKSKNYVIEIFGKKYNSKYDSESLVLFNKDGLLSIPFDNIINYHTYLNGKVSAKFEKVFLLILFIGSVYYFSGLYRILLGGFFLFLFIYPLLISKKVIFLKLKIDTEPEDKEHYRPIINTYKLFYNDIEFLKELKKHVKIYHSITRLWG